MPEENNYHPRLKNILNERLEASEASKEELIRRILSPDTGED